MNEACPTDEVKAIGALGYPKLRIRERAGGVLGRTTPCIFGYRQAMAEHVALLALDDVLGLFRQRGAVSRFEFTVLEQEAMVGGDQHRTGIEVHKDFAGQLGQFFNRMFDCIKSFRLGGGAVASCIDHVVVDVHQLLILQCLAAFIA